MDGNTTMNGIAGVWLAVTILFSLINCFFGLKLQRVWIGIICFILGFAAVAALGAQLSLSTTVSVLLGIAAGAILAAVSFKLYLAGVFLFTGGLTLLTCVLLIPITWVGWVVGVLLAVLVGLLAVKFTQPIMILATAITGGLSAAKLLLGLVPVAAVAQTAWLPVAAGAVLAAAGVLVQFASVHEKKRADKAAAKAASEAEKAATERAAAAFAAQQASAIPTAEPAAAPTAAPTSVNDTPEA